MLETPDAEMGSCKPLLVFQENLTDILQTLAKMSIFFARIVSALTGDPLILLRSLHQDLK